MTVQTGGASPKNGANDVLIFDTTLRDGEQSPGATMTFDEKLQVAELLDSMGVDIIEAGFPDRLGRRLRGRGGDRQAHQNAVVAGLARAGLKDVERAGEAVRHARRPRIHTFISTSPVHMKWKLQKEPTRSSTTSSPRSPGRARWSTTWNGVPRTPPAPSTTSCAAAARRRSRPGRRRSTSPTRWAIRCRRNTPPSSPCCAPGCRAPTRWCSPPTATTTWGWQSPIRWPASPPGRARSSAPSTASASAPATRRSKRS
jgi:hypothetical protein